MGNLIPKCSRWPLFQIIPIVLDSIQLANPDEAGDLVKRAFDEHLERLKLKLPKNKKPESLDKNGARLNIVAKAEHKEQVSQD